MSDDERNPDFFRPLGQELLNELAALPDDGARAARLSAALSDTFQSGMASTLVGVVTAIEAVQVPVDGFVLFKVPNDSGTAILRFQDDIRQVSSLLAQRMGGVQPILLVVPDTVDCSVVQFERGMEVDSSAPPPAVDRDEQARSRGARGPITAGWLRQRLVMLADYIGGVRILGTSRQEDGSLRHTIAIAVVGDPPDEGNESIVQAVTRWVTNPLRTFAAELGEVYDVLIVADFDHSAVPRNGETVRDGEWCEPDSARIVVVP